MTSFLKYLRVFRRYISRLTDDGKIISAKSVYGDHKQWCITFEMREKSGKEVGNLVISSSDTVYTYTLSKHEMQAILEAAISTWGVMSKSN